MNDATQAQAIYKMTETLELFQKAINSINGNIGKLAQVQQMNENQFSDIAEGFKTVMQSIMALHERVQKIEEKQV
ncbi:MAG: hypothetical protein ACKO96_16150 [Flammeovirgaceae bacterium]